MSADDKYPAESGRRRFVKGVVGSATLAGVGTGATVAVNTATSSQGAGGGPTQFFAIENTAGPAPRGMPQIPVTVNSDGTIEGVWPENVEDGIATMDLGGTTYQSSWFQYCGVQTYEGVRPGADQSNVFRAAASAPYDWQSDVDPGTELTVDMFDDYESWSGGIGRSGLGKPAMGTWRSQDVSPSETIPIQVLRSPIIQDMRENPGQYDVEDPQWLRASTTEEGFVAWLDKCTHFCCVPAFKAYPDSAKFGGENVVYCQCHQSLYDPFSIIRSQFVALPRPEE
jgi:Rieske Fe-S protein